MDEYGRNIKECTLALLERAVMCAVSDRLPEVNTVIVKYSKEIGVGEYSSNQVEISTLHGLIDFLTSLAKPDEKISNIRLSGRVEK